MSDDTEQSLITHEERMRFLEEFREDVGKGLAVRRARRAAGNGGGGAAAPTPPRLPGA